MSAPIHPDAIERAGTPRSAGGDRPLLLHADRVWIVRSGRIDVFATPVADGGLIGSRTHLFRVEAGGALLGADAAAGMGLLGVGAPATVVVELDTGLRRMLEDPDSSPVPVEELLEGWIRHLYEGLGLDGRTPRHRAIDPGGELEVDAGGCVRPTAPVGWLEQVTGSTLLLGRAAGGVPAGTVLPVTREAWVRAEEPSTLLLHPTEHQLRSGAEGTWRALAQLHETVLGMVAERLREAEAARRDRAERRVRAGQSRMRWAVSILAATTGSGAGAGARMRLRPRSDDEGAEDSLIPAFRLVAAARGIELEGGRSLHVQRAPRDPVQALVRSQRLRARRVALREGWWKQDGEPLLARLAEAPRAVALLPRAGGYELVDPRERTQRRVDEEVAATLGPFAYTLYRPFAPEPVGALALLRFGLHGTRRDRLTIGVMGIAAALLGLVTPLAIGALYNTIIPGAQRGQLLQLTLGLIVCALAVAAFEAVRGFALLRVESNAGPGLQAAVWDRLLSVPLPFFRDYTAGDLATRAMGIEEMRNIVSGTAVNVVLSGIFSLANFALLFAYDLRLAWIAAALVGLAVAFSLVLSYLQVRRQRVILPLRSRTAGLVLQLLAGIAKLRVASAEAYGFGLWAQLFSEQRREQFRARTLRNVQMVFTAVFPVAATMVLFLATAGAPAQAAGAPAGSAPDAAAMMPTGDFLAFIAAFQLSLTAMLSTSAALVGALAVVPLYEHVKPILQATPEVHTGRRDPGELSGAIELQHITFRYRPDSPAALNDLSIRVRPGEFVALVGPSGSGKSTVLRLLLGFELPESGSISYDEQDLQGLDPEAVRRQIGVVTQNGRLMSGDIFTNIAGSSAASIEEAWEAARMAGLDEDIRQMPMGMHTVISDGGGTFSGGQRQRLMIARALLHRPRVLFLDEATSALDNLTQDIVSRSLERLKATRIVVAHRLSTIRNADRIYVIQAGSVVETGTFDDLLARGGVFTQLAERQMI